MTVGASPGMEDSPGNAVVPSKLPCAAITGIGRLTSVSGTVTVLHVGMQTVALPIAKVVGGSGVGDSAAGGGVGGL